MRVETVRPPHKRFWQWLKDQIATDVPEADGLCEYDCRKPQCNQEEWATCERRISKAAGELWPEPSPAPRAETNPSSPSASSLLSAMIPENCASVIADDGALDDEIKRRAYELYERQHDPADRHDQKDNLQAELPRVAYAAFQLQKYSNGEIAETRGVRAARVYLGALSSFIAKGDSDRPIVKGRCG
jgi:hypothetical protein